MFQKIPQDIIIGHPKDQLDGPFSDALGHFTFTTESKYLLLNVFTLFFFAPLNLTVKFLSNVA